MTRTVTLAGYALILVAIVAAELSARARNRARFLDATAAITSHRVGRWIVLAGWVWLGFHLFARSGKP
jgi:hypothetical protein